MILYLATFSRVCFCCENFISLIFFIVVVVFLVSFSILDPTSSVYQDLLIKINRCSYFLDQIGRNVLLGKKSRIVPMCTKNNCYNNERDKQQFIQFSNHYRDLRFLLVLQFRFLTKFPLVRMTLLYSCRLKFKKKLLLATRGSF